MNTSARYRFGDSSRAGVVLGMSVRQTVPLVVGVLWLTVMLMVGLPIIGAAGPLAGGVVSFGTWRRAPLYEVASPGSRLTWARLRGHKAWTRQHLTANDNELPAGLRGIEILEIPSTWQTRQAPVGVVHDRLAGTVSIVLAARGPGFAIASPVEQDHLVGSWGAVLAPIARARCPIARVTWQEWSHPVGIAAHERFLVTTGRNRVHDSANADYQGLLDQVGPHTIAHDVHLTVTVDLRRVRSRRGTSTLEIATEVLVDECRQLATRLEVGGYVVDDPLTGSALATGVRLRSDPTRAAVVRESLASAAGRHGRGVGSDGGAAGVVRVPRRCVVASLVPGCRLADAAGRCGLDGTAAVGRRRDPDGDGRAGACSPGFGGAGREPSADLDRSRP